MAHFKSFLDEVLSHIPTKLCSSKRHVPWLTKSIQRICKRKQHLHMKAKEGKSDQAWVRYNACKRHANKELRRIRGRFIDGIIIIEYDTKLFWKYINSTHSDSTGVAPLKKNNTLFSDISDKANILWEPFEPVFTDEDLPSILELPGLTHPNISSLHISPPGVAKLVSHLKINKASGPDSIPSRLGKELGTELAPCLDDIFQKITGPYPCIYFKFLAHIVCRHLNNDLDQRHLLSRFQHGFRTRHSRPNYWKMFTTWCRYSTAVKR